jgi:hypothetical protein
MAAAKVKKPRVVIEGLSNGRIQLSIAPAAAQAFMSVTACALLPPNGGMLPPYQLRHD